MKKLILLLSIILTFNVNAQSGCTDPNATNYDASAVYNDGSCTYNDTNLSITDDHDLPAQLDEISGMIFYNGKLYGHQDSGGPTDLYEVDPADGSITKTITLSGVTNVDWEDMTQDATHIYIGDTGNNAHGNRTDLKIYKFPKSAITSETEVTIASEDIEVINYSYEDQTDFSDQGGNNTEYDCEAIGYNRGKLHLFTKNWVGTTSAHYVIPINAGTYSAKKIDTIDTGDFKITGADFGAYDFLILIGYQVTGTGDGALFLDFGFDGTYYYLNSGAKRRLDIGSAAANGQVEGVCFENALHGYVSNEQFTYTLIFFPVTVNQSIDSFNIRDYIQNYYDHNRVDYDASAQPPKPGVLRFNGKAGRVEGYDGTHWLPFNF